jgi:hypothetical protein
MAPRRQSLPAWLLGPVARQVTPCLTRHVPEEPSTPIQFSLARATDAANDVRDNSPQIRLELIAREAEATTPQEHARERHEGLSSSDPVARCNESRLKACPARPQHKEAFVGRALSVARAAWDARVRNAPSRSNR